MSLRERVFKLAVILCALFFMVISGTKTAGAIERGIRSEQESMKETTLSGITEEDRKQIYTDLVGAGERSQKEADEIHPTDPLHPDYEIDNATKNLDTAEELNRKYRGEVRDKWGITEGQQRLIMMEATGDKGPLSEGQQRLRKRESIQDKTPLSQ